LIATKAHAEESAALQASVGKKRKSRLPWVVSQFEF
jgi:hypothetical protein